MNPSLPTLPSVLSNNRLPSVPQFKFDYGQGGWEKPFTPDAGVVSTLISKLKTGEVNFDEAAQQLISSANDDRVKVGANPEEIKKSFLQSFGGQKFVGPQGQTGYFNERNYGFIPETTKNVVSRVTGYGPSTKIQALPAVPIIK